MFESTDLTLFVPFDVLHGDGRGSFQSWVYTANNLGGRAPKF